MAIKALDCIQKELRCVASCDSFFLIEGDVNGNENSRRLRAVYEENCITRSNAYERVRKFQGGTTSVADAACSRLQQSRSAAVAKLFFFGSVLYRVFRKLFPISKL